MKRILFVCTGNTCRSPMAEALLKGLAHEKGLMIAVRSAGISTINGMSVSSNALNSLQRRGIQHQGSSSIVQAEAIEWADLILTMTSGHKRQLLQLYPDVMDKIFTLKEYAYIDDALQVQLLELEQLYSELQMQQILGKQITEGQRRRLVQLENSIPSFDISDPFGGSQTVYDQCSEEIEEAIFKLVDKLLELRKKTE